MRVTCVITCHNYRDLVETAIDSFYRQDHDPKRIVIVDDGSIDGSWDIIKNYTPSERAATLPEIFRIETAQGTSFAKNLAIEQAWDYTDVFAFLDADDYYLPGYLKECVGVLQNTYGHPGIVYCDHLVEDEVRNIKYKQLFKSFSATALQNGSVAAGNLMIAKEVFMKCGKFDLDLREGEAHHLMVKALPKFMTLHVAKPLVSTKITNRSLRRRT